MLDGLASHGQPQLPFARVNAVTAPRDEERSRRVITGADDPHQ